MGIVSPSPEELVPQSGANPSFEPAAAPARQGERRRLLLRYAVIALAFTGLVAGSWAWNVHNERRTTLSMARLEARATFNKDQSFRYWATSHGGVYVPVTATTAPNPYLVNIPDRDLTTPSGRRLTLMNPAYIMRQAMQQYADLYGVRGHLTSLQPINPGNAPDAWERRGLEAFDRGAKEVAERSAIDGAPFLRFMQPMVTQDGCLKCHAAQGYQVGDIRGGLSVSVPLAPYLEIERQATFKLGSSHLLLWLFGMTGIGGAWARSRANLLERFRAAEREHLLATIVQSSDDAILSIDRSGIIRSWNRGAEQIYGYPAEEAAGRPIAMLLPPERSGEFAEIQGRLERGERIEHFETERLCRDGRRINVALTASPLRDETGRMVGLSVTSRDVTARKEAEKALLERNAELRKLSSAIEQSPVSIVITDAQGKIEYVNPKFTQVSGYSAAEAQGENPRILKSGHTSAQEYRQLWATITAGGIWQGEFQNLRKDGDLFWEQATIAPVKNEQGEITHFIAIKEDISDRKKLEEQLRQAQKMEAVGQLAGGIAHDFNNILTAIIGYSALLDMKLPAQDPLRLNVTQILASANRAAELTHGLLAFSRKQVIHLEPLDLNPTIARTEPLLRQILRADIELTIRTTGEPLTCRVDRGQFEQVLMNLASNARDAMPDGGSIVIETRTAVIDREFIRNHGYGEAGDYALISFTDNGTGMDEGTRLQIFEPFFTTKEVGRGTGLGLAMVYGMVKQHGGYIVVDSEPDQGTTFSIYLPRVPAPADGEPPDFQKGTGLTGGTETILVADDDAALRALAEEVLTQFGYTVITAADGDEALARFREHSERIALAVLDVVMPKRNGKEVWDELLRHRPDLRVLFISGYSEDIIHHHGVLDPTLAFIQKPMSPPALLKKVREVLDR